MEKLEHFLHILFFEFNRRGKSSRETFGPCVGTMPLERAWRENGFLVFRRIVLTLVTFHVKGDLRGFYKDRLNTLIEQWSTSVYSRTGKCDEL